MFHRFQKKVVYGTTSEQCAYSAKALNQHFNVSIHRREWLGQTFLNKVEGLCIPGSVRCVTRRKPLGVAVQWTEEVLCFHTWGCFSAKQDRGVFIDGQTGLRRLLSSSEEKREGRLTIFQIWLMLSVVVGLFGGIGVGATCFGWVGASLGGIAGLIFGIVVGVFPGCLLVILLCPRPGRQQIPNKAVQ